MKNETIFKLQVAISFVALFVMVFLLARNIGQLESALETQAATIEALDIKLDAIDAKYHERTIELKAGRLPPREDTFNGRRKR